MPLPEVPDFVGIIRRAAADETTRRLATVFFDAAINAGNPLSADHGAHVLRPSSFGRCSLEFAADNLGLLDLDRADDARLIMDNGTLMGLWFACLLKAGASSEAMPFSVTLEYRATYRGVPGNIDALIAWPVKGNGLADREIVELKTSPSAGEIKDPGVKKPAQCLQAASYALDPNIDAERFTIVTFGYNVGSSREGVPWPKLAQHTHKTADWKPLVDAEIDRLTALAAMPKAEVLSNAATLADAVDAFRCGSCRLSGCERNKNGARFAL